MGPIFTRRYGLGASRRAGAGLGLGSAGNAAGKVADDVSGLGTV